MPFDVVLLNPGPVTLSARVRAALAGDDLCHREPEFADLQDTIRARLRAVYALGDAWAAVVLGGSGTAAVEAMISSLPGDAAHVLVVENGVYGERMTRIAAIHGIAHEALRCGWGAAIDAEHLDRRLAASGATHVAVVHHETTTGRLNDLAAIGAVCAARGVALLVDAVSSFGAEAIDFAGLPIAALAATANKCLHGAPGAAFVIADRAALAHGHARSVYLDLAAWCERQDARSTPFTPAIPAFHALAAALAEHAQGGGWPARRDRYRRLAARVADGFAALGVEPLLDARASSCVLRAYRLPANVAYADLHDQLKARGLVIYAGQGALAASIFRIATMGAVDEAVIDALIAGVSHAMESSARPDMQAQ